MSTFTMLDTPTIRLRARQTLSQRVSNSATRISSCFALPASIFATTARLARHVTGAKTPGITSLRIAGASPSTTTSTKSSQRTSLAKRQRLPSQRTGADPDSAAYSVGFGPSRLHARQAAAHAVGGDMAVAKLRPSIPHPRSDLAPVLKMTLGVFVAIMSAVILLAPSVYASGVQAGRLPW